MLRPRRPRRRRARSGRRSRRCSRSTSSSCNPTSGSTTFPAARGATPAVPAGTAPRSSTASRPSSTAPRPAPGPGTFLGAAVAAPHPVPGGRAAPDQRVAGSTASVGIAALLGGLVLSQPQPVAGDPPRPPDAPPRRAVRRASPRWPRGPPGVRRPGPVGSPPSPRDVLVGIVIGLVVTAALLPAQGTRRSARRPCTSPSWPSSARSSGRWPPGSSAGFAIVGIWYVFLSPHYSFTSAAPTTPSASPLTAVTAAVIVLVVASTGDARTGWRARASAGSAGLLRSRSRSRRPGPGRSCATCSPTSSGPCWAPSSLAVVEPAGSRQISWGLTVGYEGRVDPNWLALIEQGSPARRCDGDRRSVFLPTIDELVEPVAAPR